MCVFISWAFYSVSWIYVSLHMMVAYCSDYHSFVIQFEITENNVSSFVLFCKGCFGYSGSFVAPYKLKNCSSISVKKKNTIGILIETALNLQIALGSMEILTLLSLYNPEAHNMYLMCLLQSPHHCLTSFQYAGLLLP